MHATRMTTTRYQFQALQDCYSGRGGGGIPYMNSQSGELTQLTNIADGQVTYFHWGVTVSNTRVSPRSDIAKTVLITVKSGETSTTLTYTRYKLLGL